jgi:hypothetical protein
MWADDISPVKNERFQQIKNFDLLHKTSLTVPMYADRLVLFAFGPSMASAAGLFIRR